MTVQRYDIAETSGHPWQSYRCIKEDEDGDYVTFEDYAALLEKCNALERELCMSEAKCKGYFSDAAAESLKCLSLAAENAGLKLKAKELIGEASLVYSKYNDTQMPDRDLVDMQTLQEMHDMCESGSGGAFLAEVRAQGVEMFANWIIELIHEWNAQGATPENVSDFHKCVKHAKGFADQLCKGEKA